MKSRSYIAFLSLTFFSLTMIPGVHAEKNDANNVPVNQAASHTAVNTPTSTASPLFNTENEDPFAEMEKAQKGWGNVVRETYRRMKNYQQSGKFFEPDADFVEEPNQYILRVDLPGMKKDQINIEADKTDLTISGERKTDRQYKSQDGTISQFERSSGSFSRTLSVPSDANTEAISAKYENGVLEVSLPKLAPEKSKAKKVQIQ